MSQYYGLKVKMAFVAVILAMFLLSGVCVAQDTATLKLKQELAQERLARIEAQSVILQQQYQQTKAELETVAKALKAVEDKGKKASDKAQ